MTTAIRIENVSKLYRLGTVGTGTIAHDLNRWWHQIRGKEDPYAKIGQINDRTKKAASDEKREASSDSSAIPSPLASRLSPLATSPDYVWALRDINLEVQQGEILGIIGRNGAGKSTLLKLLSRVTAPTTGSIKTKGRIASLLEVGTGFHPDLTGRENIYLNGAILGMRRHEIVRQLDEIVEFSGCAKYLDTPIKRYSSGMTVRLGFAVAAHLDPEILIVDEVLAVGDLEFQRKCLGKMNDVAAQGRTVLFVSHNMSSISQLCRHGVVMNSGYAGEIKPIDDAVSQYLLLVAGEESGPAFVRKLDLHAIGITEISVRQLGLPARVLRHDEIIEIDFEIAAGLSPSPTSLSIAICDRYERKVFTAITPAFDNGTTPGSRLRFTLNIRRRFLMPGDYTIIAGLLDQNLNILDLHRFVSPFTLINAGDDTLLSVNTDYGVVFGEYHWISHIA